MHRMILKSAVSQMREFRAKAEEEGIELPSTKKGRSKFDFDQDGYSALKENRKNSGKSLRDAKRNLRRESLKEKQDTSPKFSWSFEEGELVEIKESAFRKNKNIMNELCLYPGAVGVIVETQDGWTRKSNYINVLGPTGLQRWKSSWVKYCEE